MSNKAVLLLLFLFSLLVAITLNQVISGTRASPNASFSPQNTTSTPILPTNRTINWSQSGVPGGIPDANWPICANVANPPYNAKGDGVTNDTAAIQRAINTCPNDSVVYIPAGTYILNGYATTPVTSGSGGSLIIWKSIALRGAGWGLTTLVPQYPIGITATGQIAGAPYPYYASNWTAGFSKGGTVITLTGYPSNLTTLHMGQELLLDELNDPSWVNTTSNQNPGPQACGRNGVLNTYSGVSRCAYQIVRVTGINGDTVTIDTPLYYTHKIEFVPQAFWWGGGNLQYAGVEDIAFNGVNNGDRLVTMNFCSYCWVNNSAFYYVPRAAVQLSGYDYKSEVINSYFDQQQPPLGPTRYGVEIRGSTATLIQNNIFDKIYVPVILAFSAGSVIGYNYARNYTEGIFWPMVEAIGTHSAQNYETLVEGNKVGTVIADNIWGSGSQMVIFRNRIYGYEINASIWWQTTPITIAALNLYDSAIGNILGSRGVYINSVNSTGATCDK